MDVESLVDSCDDVTEQVIAGVKWKEVHLGVTNRITPGFMYNLLTYRKRLYSRSKRVVLWVLISITSSNLGVTDPVGGSRSGSLKNLYV